MKRFTKFQKHTPLLIIFLFFSSVSISQEIVWEKIGPGGGGWISTMTVANDADNTVYVGCDVGGIYKSTDHGNTWGIKNKGLTNYFLHKIVNDPVTPETLYIASRSGVYKTINGGDEWVSKRAGFPAIEDFSFSAPIADIVIDPSNRNILYAGVGVPQTGYDIDYHWDVVEEKGAVYKSVDYAENWVKIFDTGINTNAMIYSMAVDYDNANIVYAATDKGVYKSVDAAATWTAINIGLPHQIAMKLVINPDNTDILYVTLWAEPGIDSWNGGVYKSINGGATWVEKNVGLPQEVGLVSGLTCNYPDIAIDGQNPEILYVGNIPWTPNPGVYKSINGGDSWTWVSRPEGDSPNMEIGWITEHGVSATCLALDPIHSNRLYFGTSMHLFKTDDAGDSWTQGYTVPMGDDYWKSTGFQTTVAQTIAVDPQNSNLVYAGYWDIGFFKSLDGGISFKKVNEGFTYTENTFDIIVDPANSANLYAACGWWDDNLGEVYKSTDFGESWTPLTNGIPDAQIWSIALDKNSPVATRTLYAASYGNGVYKTTDGGANWFAINTGLGIDTNLQVRKIYIDPNNSDILYAGMESIQTEDDGGANVTINGGLFKSTNAGDSWTRIDASLPQISVWDIEVVIGNSDIIYTGVSSEYNHSEGTDYYGGVYKSTDGGTSWEMVNSGFGLADNLNISSIAISPAHNDIVYAVSYDAPYHDECSGRGIFKTSDAGANWTPINNGLGVLYYNVITIDPSTPTILYAGSGGNGILKANDMLVGIEEIESPLCASFNTTSTPNPFSTSTAINFCLPKADNVQISIFNINGQLVKTIAQNTELKAGNHSVLWLGEDNTNRKVANGIYFYVLKTNTNTSTGKIVFVK